jgi:hypothetical protein
MLTLPPLATFNQLLADGRPPDPLPGRPMICGASISRPHIFYMAKVNYYGIGTLKTIEFDRGRLGEGAGLGSMTIGFHKWLLGSVYKMGPDLTKSRTIRMATVIQIVI